MKKLFVNNFRGFSNVFIPFEEVNFFVGENSTGKTSILNLIRLLSSPQFWMNNDFALDDTSFSHFKDIVSIHSKNNKDFDIGFCSFDEELEGYEKTKAFLMTFIERDGVPFLSILTYYAGKYSVRIRFSANVIKYKLIESIEVRTLAEFMDNIFSQWIIGHKEDTKGYHVIRNEKNILPRSVPLFLIPRFITDERLLNKETSKKENHFLHSDFFSPSIFGSEVAWLAPIRSKPKRTYDTYKSEFSPEGDHTPYLIKKILDKDAIKKQFERFIQRIGKDSGLFEGVEVKKYGVGATSPFELDVVLNGKPLSVCSVGYGVSQSLPVIVELFIREKGAWFAIQQPEVHLHPKAQAALGDVFFDLALEEGKKFFIETHSDYTIDRFRLRFRDDETANPPKAQILFFERDGSGNNVFPISFDENGDLPSEQPHGYREFFVKEEMKILGL